MKRTNQWLGIMMSVMLVAGSLQVPVYAAEMDSTAVEAETENESVEMTESEEPEEDLVIEDPIEDEGSVDEAEQEEPEEFSSEDTELTEAIQDQPEENDQESTDEELEVEANETTEESTDQTDVATDEVDSVETAVPSEETIENVITEEVAPDETSTEVMYEGTEMPEDAEYWCGHYYMVFDEALTPAQAAAKCESMGGYLATATTEKEYNFIDSLIDAKSRAKSAYQLMGIQRRDDGWYWDDGEEFCYRNWADFGDEWAGDGWHTLTAGCLGWSDEAIKEVVVYGDIIYEKKWNGWCWELNLDEGTSASEHNLAICNGTISFSRYATWGGRTSVTSGSGMVEYNESNVANGYVCEWGEPISLKEEHVFLNGQTRGYESPVRYEYNGNSKKPESIAVYYDGIELEEDKDYIYEVKSRSTVGAARVVITGINRYQGVVNKYYYIVPRMVSGLEVERTNENRGLKLNWTELDETKEYDVRWSTNRDDLTDDFDDTKVPVYSFPFVEGEDNTYYTGTLKRGTTYYVQVRGVGDTKYKYDVGDWSDIAEITTGNQIILDEFWGFGNYSSNNRYIGYDAFCKVFGPAEAVILYTANGGREYKKAQFGGLCYGMLTFAEALYKKYPSSPFGLSSLREIPTLEKAKEYEIEKGFNAYDGIKICHLLQARDDYLEAEKTDLSELYNAIKSCQEGNSDGFPVCINLCESSYSYNGGKQYNHTIYAVCIEEEMETDSYAVIRVYDSNTHKNKERFLYLLKNSDGNFDGWSFTGDFDEERAMSGSVETADKDDCLTYLVNIGEKINTDLNSVINNKYNWLEAGGLLCFSGAYKDVEKVTKFIEDRIERILFSDSSNTSDDDEAIIYKVNGDDPLELSMVPAGTTIAYSKNYHFVTVETSSDSDVTISVSDDNTGSVIVVPRNNSTCTITYSYQESAQSDAIETEITCNLKKDQKAAINKYDEKDIRATGVASLDYHSETGKRNDYSAIEPDVSHNVKKDNLDIEKEYKMTETSDEAQILSKDDESEEFEVIEARESEMANKDISENAVVTVSNQTYSGGEQKPLPTVEINGEKLICDTDFTVSYENNIKPGTATITITGIGSYTGTITKTFLILPGKTTRGDMFNLGHNIKVTWKEVPGAKYYKVYREGITDPKETQKVPVIVTARLVGWDDKWDLTNGHAYRYKIVASLTGKDDPSGDSPLSYSKIMYRLNTVAIWSAKNTAPGKVTVKYDKTKSGDSYVLQYCERQDMVGAKTKVVLGANNTSYTIGGLKKGKTYYISIRVRKKVNGINYYTTFGVAKKVTITK